MMAVFIKFIFVLITLVNETSRFTFATAPTGCEEGWKLNGESCYKFVSDRIAYSAAFDACRTESADLVTILHSNENAWVAKELSFDHSWLGLNYKKGKYVWTLSDGRDMEATYFNWNEGEPNNFEGVQENCVVIYSAQAVYDREKWNDVPCSDLVPGYTCKKVADVISDVDECALPSPPCHGNAQCSNTEGSFTCSCKEGYLGDGLTCLDVDECSLPSSPCHGNAQCLNTEGSFTCSCKEGYLGDGLTCSEAERCEVAHLYRLAETNHGMPDEYVHQSLDDVPSAAECSKMCDNTPMVAKKCRGVDYSKTSRSCHLLSANSVQLPNVVTQKPGFKHYHKNIRN